MVHTRPKVIDDARDELSRSGFFVCADSSVGFGPEFRHHLDVEYFESRTVHRQEPDVPADRLRARDVFAYERDGADVYLEPSEAIALPASDSEGKARIYERAGFCADARIREWTTFVLSIVPPERALESGTFGVNLFRTFTNVVTAPHRDNAELVVIYVLQHKGQGATTVLSDDDGQVVFEQQLRPGNILLFRDADYRHWTGPLLPAGDNDVPLRDVMVCTVDYPKS